MKSKQHRIEWLVAAGLMSACMWWLVWVIVTAFNAGNPGFNEVVNFILARVGGS